MNTTKDHTKLEAAAAVRSLRYFISQQQLSAIGELCYSEERQLFINKLVELVNTVQTMPQTYQTDGQGENAIVYLHYFVGGANWYITERDCLPDQLQTFGLADLYGDGGELGYISIEELKSCGAEIDLYWTAKPLSALRNERG